MDELPEEDIVAAETRGSPAHSHEDVTDDDDALADHLRSVHGLDAPDHLSGSTRRGLHDRLHDETNAGDD
jgi:hypothetical protein